MLGNSRGRPSGESAPQTWEAVEVAFREGLDLRFAQLPFRPSRKTPSGGAKRHRRPGQHTTPSERAAASSEAGTGAVDRGRWPEPSPESGTGAVDRGRGRNPEPRPRPGPRPGGSGPVPTTHGSSSVPAAAIERSSSWRRSLRIRGWGRPPTGRGPRTSSAGWARRIRNR